MVNARLKAGYGRRPDPNKVRAASYALSGLVKNAYSLHGLFSGDARMGNAFVKVDDDFAVMTPTGDKSMIDSAHVSLLETATGRLANGIRQTSEYRMYIEILKSLPGTKAGIHLHGCFSLPLARAKGIKALDVEGFAESDYYIGRGGKRGKVVQVNGKSGSAELAKSVARAFNEGAQVVMMLGSTGEYHGTVAISSNGDAEAAAREALNKLIDIEYMAKIRIIELALGSA